jgi:NAD(P)-dependent dehydrogenase (short-subunit alcohol dehydrogenase family)
MAIAKGRANIYNHRMDRWRDKVVLVTGGSSGIGRAAALRLAGQGARVVVASRNVEALAEVVRTAQDKGAEALAVPTDVGHADQCRRAVDTTVARFGRLDVLLCSAGVSMRAFFDGSDLTAMEQVMRVNFFGTLYATYFAIPHVKRSKGSLVAISSLTGKRGVPSYAVYGASKFAVQGLYESLRLELRPDGVHVGVVSPGFVDTPLRERVLGPNGQPWPEPPAVPFRLWPVDKCVDRVMHLIAKRRPQALLPWFAGPLLTLDQMLGHKIGDFLLAGKFPPESPAQESAV